MYYVLLAVGLWPQVVLSKKPSRWPGLVIPAIMLLSGIVFVLASVGIPQADHTTNQLVLSSVKVFAALFNALMFILPPPAIYLAVYGVVRNRERRKRELMRMSAEDLG